MYKITDLNPEEIEIFEKYQTIKNSTNINLTEYREITSNHPFVLNTSSLFPNHFLNNYFREKINFETLTQFKTLIENAQNTERHMLNFLQYENAFIISYIMEHFTTFGHHEAYFFKEFQLPPTYQADFLLIGKNSHGYHFLFIELENIYDKITIQDGKFGETIRKGLNQIDDWKFWIERNFSSLRPLFMSYKNPQRDLPSEFIEFDSSRFHYAVIAGRRDDFTDVTKRKVREELSDNIILTHYDKLIDGCEERLNLNAN